MTAVEAKSDSVSAPSIKRRWRNYLIDAPFQLKVTAWVVGLTLVVAGALGALLWRTTEILFAETQDAVAARQRAAQVSHELGNAVLSNDILQHLNDPSFEAQFKARSEKINREYEAERVAIVEARTALVQRQRMTWWVLVGSFAAFVVVLGLSSIVLTHKIAGPLFRLRRLSQEVAAGSLRPSAAALREGDEFRGVYEAFASMLEAMRLREEEDVARAASALAAARREGVGPELLRELERLEESLRQKVR